MLYVSKAVNPTKGIDVFRDIEKIFTVWSNAEVEVRTKILHADEVRLAISLLNNFEREYAQLG